MGRHTNGDEDKHEGKVVEDNVVERPVSARGSSVRDNDG